MYCNIAKSQVFPLVFRVSSQPKFLKPSLRLKTQSFSNGVYPNPSETIGFYPKTLIKPHVVKPRSFSTSGFRRKSSENNNLGERKFRINSPSRNGEGRNVGRARVTLPWIEAAYKNTPRRSKNVSSGNGTATRSSWGESADNFLLKTEVRSPVEERRRITRTEEIIDDVPEEKNEENVEVPRWDNNSRSGYRRFDDGNDRYERPDVRQWNRQETWGKKTWKDATDSTVPRMVGEGIYGVGPVLAALSAGRREFYALYVQEGLDLSNNNRKKKDKKGFEKILKIAEKLGLTPKDTSKHDLNMVADNRPHQGLVLDASPLEMVKIRELDPVSVEGNNGPLWVALDEVTDPQNLGAIIRSSYFFGAAGVVLCAKNSAPLSGVVSKASAGSLELMEVRACKNMMQFLSQSAENGWRVLGGSISSHALPLNKVPAGVPTILVLGSEGTGLRPLVERSCTDLIRIPGNIPVDISVGSAEDAKTEVDSGCWSEELRSFLAVESLNVSVAAGVLLHHLVGNNSSSSDLADNQTNVPE
ncbi:hypothetical protein GIB67_027900 [Kingdonia uniflora]|uniref:rRNA methyltransferase 1, mitochondrial n=1 Tax=Kingdonia uniflora TaxID=39325 RepID=A0A7J7LGL0_9MAGN|nr:hypothetical protein GIB67_027900 [Kingdonia uniflora]